MTEEQRYAKLSGGWGVGDGESRLSFKSYWFSLSLPDNVLTLHTGCSLWINYTTLINTEAHTTETCMRLYVQTCLYFNIVKQCIGF